MAVEQEMNIKFIEEIENYPCLYIFFLPECMGKVTTVTACGEHLEMRLKSEFPGRPMSILERCRDTLIEFTNLASLRPNAPREPPTPTSDDSNPITAWFDIREPTTSAGPGLMWTVHNAYKKADGKQCSVFFFDKREGDKMFKPKRKDDILVKMRDGIANLQSPGFKQTLVIVHELVEGPNTMAFATEPVLTSLHHVFAWYESMFDQEPVLAYQPSSSLYFREGRKKKYKRPRLQQYAKEYYFLEVEIRYGFLQIIDALNCLHYEKNMVHTNICPQNVIITRQGIWKLIGLEFLKPITTIHPSEFMDHEPYNVKFDNASQSNLDYSAPEVQEFSQINTLSDMFSFGMIIFAFYNNGKSLFDARDSPDIYLKQLETLTQRVLRVLPKMPTSLQEAAERLLSREIELRPPTALLPITNYFSVATRDPVILALQGFARLPDMVRAEKITFLKGITKPTIDQLPKKLRFTFVFEAMKPELRTADGLGHGLPMIAYMVKDEPDEVYTDVVYPAIKNVYTKHFIDRNALAVKSYLDAMHIFLSKCDNKTQLREEIIPILMVAFDNNDKTVLASAVQCLMRCMEWLDDDIVLCQALPFIRPVLERHYNDLRMSLTVMDLFDMIMWKLEKQHLVAYVVPSIVIMKLNDATVMKRFIRLYNRMVADERLGLPYEMMATKIIPAVAPHLVNKKMDQEQFIELMEMVQHMLKFIEEKQRIAIEEYKNRPPSPPKNLACRQTSIDEPAPEFCIPSLKARRKVSSAEEVARKFSEAAHPSFSTTTVTGNIRRLSHWIFGSNNSTNSNNMNNAGAGPSGASGAGPSSIAAAASGNFLRVVNLLPGRRLSDNTLMAPKIKIAPSCVSSPGGTPGGSQAGLPTRRHSSIGPQEHRPCATLSPPTAQHGRGRGAGSGSSLSVPTPSHPAGGSLPGSCTTSLEPAKGSAQSVHSAQSALAARAFHSLRNSPARMRRLSGCPPSASSGAAAASLQGADFAQCSPNAVRRLPMLPIAPGAGVGTSAPYPQRIKEPAGNRAIRQLITEADGGQ